MKTHEALIMAIFFLLIIALVVYEGNKTTQEIEFYKTRALNLESKNNELLNASPLDKPLLTYMLDSWGVNYYNNKELLFSGWVYNYGNTEAKDVEITCYINKDKVTLDSKTENIGNVASNSWIYKEIKMDRKITDMNTTGVCFYTKSSNEGVNLLQNFKEFKEIVK